MLQIVPNVKITWESVGLSCSGKLYPFCNNIKQDVREIIYKLIEVTPIHQPYKLFVVFKYIPVYIFYTETKGKILN